MAPLVHFRKLGKIVRTTLVPAAGMTNGMAFLEALPCRITGMITAIPRARPRVLRSRVGQDEPADCVLALAAERDVVKEPQLRVY